MIDQGVRGRVLVRYGHPRDFCLSILMGVAVATCVSCSDGEINGGTVSKGAPSVQQDILDAYLAATVWERHADPSFVEQYNKAEAGLQRLGTGGAALVARRLRGASPEEALALLRASAVFGDMSLPHLTDVQRFMESPDPAVASMAMWAAVSIAPSNERTIARVAARAIGERDCDALGMLPQLGESARAYLPALWHMVFDENLLAATELKEWHYCACVALGGLRAQEAASLLTELALRTGHIGLCRAAVSVSGAGLVPVLLPLLGGSEGAARQSHSATLAGFVGDPRLTAGLLTLYEQTADEETLWRAASALADMPAVGAKAVDRLLATVRSRDDRIRRLVLSAVARSGSVGETSRAVLADLASSDADPYIRRTAGALLRGERPK